MVKNICGICPAISTPFDENGNVDYSSLRRLIDKMHDWNCTSLVGLAYASEFYKLSEDEQISIANVIVDECKKEGINSILAVCEHSSSLAIKRAKHYQEIGADCILLIPSFVLPISNNSFLNYVDSIVAEIEIPIMLQYCPDVSQMSIAPEIFKNLTEKYANIKYFKIECQNSGPYISELLMLTDNTVHVLSGNAGTHMLECFDRGAIGVVPGCSLADLYANIFSHLQKGNRETAITLNSYLQNLVFSVHHSSEELFSFEKEILFRRGIISTPYCRDPQCPKDQYVFHIFEENYNFLKKYLN